MIQQQVYLPFGWNVDIFYDSRPKDAITILRQLRRIGCSERHLHKASILLRSGIPNQGLTYSIPHGRRSLIVIGHTTDVFELFNSLSHECQHLEQAVCREFGLDPYGEEIAYISGDITQSIAMNAMNAIKSFFCKYE